MNFHLAGVAAVIFGMSVFSLEAGFLDGLKSVGSGLADMGKSAVDGAIGITTNAANATSGAIRLENETSKSATGISSDDQKASFAIPSQADEKSDVAVDNPAMQKTPGQKQQVASGYGRDTIEQYINGYLHRIQVLDARAKKCGVRPRNVNTESFVRQLFEQHCRSDDRKAIPVAEIHVDEDVRPLLEELTHYWGETGRFDFPVNEKEYKKWTGIIDQNICEVEEKCRVAEKELERTAQKKEERRANTLQNRGDIASLAKTRKSAEGVRSAAAQPAQPIDTANQIKRECTAENTSAGKHNGTASENNQPRKLSKEEARSRLEKFLNAYLIRLMNLNKMAEECRISTEKNFIPETYVNLGDGFRPVLGTFEPEDFKIDQTLQGLLKKLSEECGTYSKNYTGFNCPERPEDFQRWEEAIWKNMKDQEDRCAKVKAKNEQIKAEKEEQDRRISLYVRKAYCLGEKEAFTPQKAFRDTRFGMKESVVRSLVSKMMGENISDYNVEIKSEYALPGGLVLTAKKVPGLHVSFTFARFDEHLERILVRVKITPNYTPGYNELKSYGWKIDDVVSQYKKEIQDAIFERQKYVKEEAWGADDLSQAWKYMAFLTYAKVNLIKTCDPNGRGALCEFSESEKTLLKKCEADLETFKKLGLQKIYGERFVVKGKYVVVSMEEDTEGRTGAITVSDEKLCEALRVIAKAQKDKAEKVEQEKREKERQQKMSF